MSLLSREWSGGSPQKEVLHWKTHLPLPPKGMARVCFMSQGFFYASASLWEIKSACQYGFYLLIVYLYGMVGLNKSFVRWSMCEVALL